MQKLISKRSLGLILGAAFVLSAFFGVHLTMQNDMNGQMQDCPFMANMKSVCPMSITEHINAWQQLFTANPQSSKLLLAIFAAMSLLFGALAFKFGFAFPSSSFQLVRNKSGPPLYHSNFLIETFGNGIARKRE